MQANRYIKLSQGEVLTLEEGGKNHKKAYFRMRCESLLLSNRGYKVEEIARLFEVRTHTVRFWMDRWESYGVAGLQISKGRGRKARISLADTALVEAIQAQVELNPQSLETVCEQVNRQQHVSLSKGQLKRFLKKVSLPLAQVPNMCEKMSGCGKLSTLGGATLSTTLIGRAGVYKNLLWG